MSLSIAKYKVDFQNFSTNALAWFYRFEWLKDFIFSIIAPLQDINDEFYARMVTVNNYLSYTSNHLAMEELLNDNYDLDLRRIYITENNITGQLIDIYQEAETTPLPVSIYKQGEVNPIPIVTYKQSELPVSLYDFTINIPISITYDSDIFDKLVTSYVDTKTYNVVTF